MKSFFRILSQVLFRTRSFTNKHAKKFAKKVHHRKVLELGSGKKKNGKYYYSAKRFFDSSNEFVQSDLNPKFGHLVVNVTTMDFKEEFDVILCLNVLEHVYDFHTAVDNMYKALKPGGVVAIVVPVCYPLHDEPHDYWRFTEHSFRKILKDFNTIKISYSGVRQFPFAYFVEAKK